MRAVGQNEGIRVDTSVLVWLVVVVVFGLAVAYYVKESNQKEELEQRLRSMADFSPSQLVWSCNSMSALAVDEERQKLCLVKRTAAGYAERVLPARDLLSAELFENGNSVTKTIRSSQIGGALIGGLAFGGVGAIIGGLSGKTVTSNKIRQVDLRLTVNDTTTPLHDVAFMNVEASKDGIIHSQAMRQARHWHGVLEILIKRADDEARAQMALPAIAPAEPVVSVADELRKLADLRIDGLLSNEEFERQKAKLLASA